MRVLFLLCAYLFVFSSVSVAQGFMQEALKIEELNRIKPLQNPVMETGEKVVDRTITDSRNKVVGEVEDVIINQEGAVDALYTSFERLHQRQNIYLNYTDLDVGSLADGYKLPFTQEKIEEIYPDLLAHQKEMKDKVKGLISYYELIGMDVVGPKGAKIGSVQEILFDQDAKSALAIYIDVNFRIMRHVGVAIPYEAYALEYKHAKNRVLLSEEWIDAVLDYAREQ